MTAQTYTIPGNLPTMNEIIAAAKKHYAVYAKMKKINTQKCGTVFLQIPDTLQGKHDYTIDWYRPNRRTDKDNIMAGTKFILDGLVNAGKIPNDGWGEIGKIQHTFHIDKDNPRVEVTIIKSQN